MFDEVTTQLIQRAPVLTNLDTERLPEQLTEAYAQIVSIRSQLRDSIDDLQGTVTRLQNLARTYEAYASILRERANRSSAAFVGATAYRLLYLAQQLQKEAEPPSSQLDRDFISPDISSTLLFLIAGYSGDAAEMAMRITTLDDDSVVSHLLRAIVALATGNLRSITDAADLELFLHPDEDIDDFATRQLFRQIFAGIRELAAELLFYPENVSSDEIFRSVLFDAVDELEIAGLSANGRVFSTFPGPHHLASLLLTTGEVLRSVAVSKTPPPTGIPNDLWTEQIQRMAIRRPYLWENHREAIAQGYLEPGTSSVLSFPTGAGKSTLAEMKIAVARVSDKSALFLVPTHALVSQVVASLRKAFPEDSVRTSFLLDGEYSEVEQYEIPDIAVMTPERCLAFEGIAPGAFAEIGLVVFDECHLLHPREEHGDQRSLDAMLCLLGLFDVASDADYVLMSAMMQNTDEIAKWIESVTGRGTLAIDLEWKPTRQARGCIVYESDRIEALRQYLADQKRNATDRARAKTLEWQKTGGKGKRPKFPPEPSAAVAKPLSARPHCFFCLKQTWQTVAVDDYCFLPMLEEHVPLGVSKFWRLTANRNEVAARLTSRFAQFRVKTLVFAQNRIWAESITKKVVNLIGDERESCNPTEEEVRLLEIAAEEAGGVDHVFAPLGGTASCHHSLLLPAERQLNESAFSRPDGINILAATPTLAQGMNLPAEVVIIAGDDRFEEEVQRANLLAAHELLNAAGRAGRAGFVAQGLVLIIPGDVLSLDVDDNAVSPEWFQRQEIFSNPDKCLAIEDPIDLLLDRIQTSGDMGLVGEYFLRRLPTSKESADQLLQRSLGAFQARRRKKWKAFQRKVSNAIRIKASLDTKDHPDWQTELATRTGVSTAFVASMASAIGELSEVTMSQCEWVRVFFDWIQRDQSLVSHVFSDLTLNDLAKAGGGRRRDMSSTLQLFQELVIRWMKGETLRELELTMGIKEAKLSKCVNARKFVTKWLRELSYSLGVVAQIYRTLLDQSGKDNRMPIGLACLAACAREGLDRAELLAIRYEQSGIVSRKMIHDQLAKIESNVADGHDFETFVEVQSRVRSALFIAK